jgi:zinc protease
MSMAADMLPTLLSRGTKKHTREQIEDELDRLNSHVTFSGGLGSITVSIQTRAETLEPTLKLVGEMLREPSFPAAELEILKGETLDSLKSGLTDPEALASLELERKLAPYPKSNIRYVPTLAENIEMVETVKLEQIINLYNQQVGGTVGELAMVGNFDPKTVKEQFETLLKDWKSETAYERIDSPALEIKGERVTINTPDKENAVYVGGQVFGMKDNDPDYPALLVGNFVFGGGPLSSRLADRMRQKQGLSYSVGSSLSARALERHGSFTVFAICNPDNISKVNTAVLDELEHYLKEGIGDKELQEGKEAFLEDQRISRSGDSAVVGYLAATLHAGRTFAYYAERDRQIAALTVDQVNAAFRKYISPKSLIIVEAGDFKKK